MMTPPIVSSIAFRYQWLINQLCFITKYYHRLMIINYRSWVFFQPQHHSMVSFFTAYFQHIFWYRYLCQQKWKVCSISSCLVPSDHLMSHVCLDLILNLGVYKSKFHQNSTNMMVLKLQALLKKAENSSVNQKADSLPRIRRPTPLAIRKLDKFLRNNKMRLIDIFQAIDKDKNWNLSREEFRHGVELVSENTVKICSICLGIKT